MLHYGAKSIERRAFWEGQNLVAECCALILRHPVLNVHKADGARVNPT